MIRKAASEKALRRMPKASREGVEDIVERQGRALAKILDAEMFLELDARDDWQGIYFVERCQVEDVRKLAQAASDIMNLVLPRRDGSSWETLFNQRAYEIQTEAMMAKIAGVKESAPAPQQSASFPVIT